MTQSSVRYLGSRELHRELPRILDELTDQDSRLVLTIHAKPKAVLIGADAFAELVRQVGDLDRRLGEELAALLNAGKGKVRMDHNSASKSELPKGSRTAMPLRKSRGKVQSKSS